MKLYSIVFKIASQEGFSFAFTHSSSGDYNTVKLVGKNLDDVLSRFKSLIKKGKTEIVNIQFMFDC